MLHIPLQETTKWPTAMIPRRLLAVLLLWVGFAVRADYPLQIVELRSSLPEEILPVIQPLLGPGESASSARNVLLLRVAPEHSEELRQVIDRLDRPARRLLITVGRGADYAVDDRWGGGRVSEDGGQRIQTLEGRPAFIHVGRSIAVPERTTIIRGDTLITQRTTDYRDALQGIYVVPRVVGDQVTLEIHQRHDQPGMRRGDIQLQRADSVVSGRLGEWIGLGGVSGEVREGGGYAASQSLDLRVRVTELP